MFKVLQSKGNRLCLFQNNEAKKNPSFWKDGFDHIEDVYEIIACLA